MNCKTAQRQMALAVGEDLSPNESQELQGHLEACSNCQKTWEQQQQGFAVLQRSRSQEIPQKSDSVWPMLATRLRERETNSPRGEFNGWFAALAVTAACVLVFVFSQDSSIRPLASRPRSGSVSGSTTVDFPLDWRQTPPPVRPKQEDVPTRPGYNPRP